MPQKAWRRYGNIRFDPNTWAHVAAKGAHNRHDTVDNRIEVVPQIVSHDQATGVSPTVDDLKPTNAPLDTGGEQKDPTHQRRQGSDAPERGRKPSRLHNLH